MADRSGPRAPRSLSNDPGANRIRWMGAIVLAALAYWTYSHQKPGFARRAEVAVKATGATEIHFDRARERNGKTVICGTADGKLFLYREPQGLSKDDGSLAFITLVRDACA
ncbi:hypothetical protein [Brevundimonas goettingensis]|nr:hypothetical protein [Brevundimonas goettingensis]